MVSLESQQSTHGGHTRRLDVKVVDRPANQKKKNTIRKRTTKKENRQGWERHATLSGLGFEPGRKFPQSGEIFLNGFTLDWTSNERTDDDDWPEPVRRATGTPGCLYRNRLARRAGEVEEIPNLILRDRLFTLLMRLAPVMLLA